MVSVDSSDQLGWRKFRHLSEGKLYSDTLREEYDRWTTSYKQDHDQCGYAGPVIAALKVAQLESRKDCRVLDVACGTGLVGEQLAKHSFTNVDGVDLSQKSIDMARNSGFYKNLTACDVNERGLPGEKDQYDVLTCIGSFIPGHLTHDVFPEFCRVVKPGGHIVIFMREEYLYTKPVFKGGQMDAAIIELVENETWHYVSRERVNGYLNGMHGALFTFQMC